MLVFPAARAPRAMSRRRRPPSVSMNPAFACAIRRAHRGPRSGIKPAAPQPSPSRPRESRPSGRVSPSSRLLERERRSNALSPGRGPPGRAYHARSSGTTGPSWLSRLGRSWPHGGDLEADDEPPRFFRRSHIWGWCMISPNILAPRRPAASPPRGRCQRTEAPTLGPTSRPIPAPTTKSKYGPYTATDAAPDGFPTSAPSHAPTMTRAPAGTTKPTIVPTTVAPARAPVPLPTKAPSAATTVAPTTALATFCSAPNVTTTVAVSIGANATLVFGRVVRRRTQDAGSRVMVSLDLVHGLKQRPVTLRPGSVPVGLGRRTLICRPGRASL